jgi:TolA-binding protein
MKRTERHHLRENEVQNFVRVARRMFTARRGESTLIIALIVAAGVAALGYYGWHEHVQSRATSLLADATLVQDARIGPPPAPGTPANGLYFPTERERTQAALTKFKIAADAYPSADAGIYARYQLAATYMTLGQAPQAATAYQQVIDTAGTSFYGQMARLGLAEAQARAGQYDQAINAFKDLSLRKDGPLPVDGILMQLGRVYVDAGKKTEAQQTFNRVVEEFPESPFSGDAKKELDNLKKT